MNKKKILNITIIIAIIIATFFIGIELLYKSAYGRECCDCNGDGSLVQCIGGMPTDCLECCECKYDLIKRITIIYNFFTNIN